jgi:hypothetical protein
MGSVKSMGNRTGCHTVDPASLRGQLGGVQTLPAVMGSTLAERARRELLTAGETTRKRTAQPARTPPGPASGPLTAQGPRSPAG